MYKITVDQLLLIAKTLEKADFAINTLERLGQNKAVFLETKKDIQKLRDDLTSRYDLKSFNNGKNK